MDYSSLINRLSILVETGASVREVEAALSAIRFDLSTLFSNVLNDHETLEHIQRESFLHEPDFDRFVIRHDRTLLWRLRLNVWWPKRAAKLRATVKIHNHTWDHASLVLAGTLSNHFYAPAAGAQLYHYHATSRGTPQEHFDLIGRSAVTDMGFITRSRGETYHQSHAQFHQIKPLTDFLATLCFHNPPQHDTTHLFTDTPEKDSPIAYFQKPDVHEVRRSLERAVRRIQNDAQ